jgi:flagellar FliJ protein
MAKFRFNLQMLLQHREDIEQDARDELMRRSFRLQSEQQNLEELKIKSKTTAHEMAAKQGENLAHGELGEYRLYLKRLLVETENSEKSIVKLRAAVEEQKRAVIEASKKRKTLSSLRDKREKVFNIEQEKSWQKEMDDLVVVRYKSGRQP